MVEEHVLDKNMQHNDIYKRYGGIVVSQWFRHENIIKVQDDEVNMVQMVYGQKGFGDRSCAKSLGTNVYIGKRQTEALVGNPL